MKKLIALGAIVLATMSTSVPAVGAPSIVLAVPTLVKPQTNLEWIVEAQIEQTKLEQEAAEQQRIREEEAARQLALETNTVKINKIIKYLTDRVDKTRYVFSGSTPNGWDCSGLVLWMYGELGVELKHSASVQQYAGVTVEQPKLGDIVVFKYNGRSSAYHVGIYLYPDTMIHAGGGKGDATSIVSISKFAGQHSKVVYRRILETK
jgi:cell wall-associated NlpC family hydrolase